MAEIDKLKIIRATKTSAQGHVINPNEMVLIDPQFTPNKFLGTDANGDIVTKDGGSGASALSQLTDVTLSSPANNQLLKYDGSKWVNTAIKTVNSTSLVGSGDVSVATAAQGAKADTAVQNLSDLGITATATELNYVDGVTSAIQTQLNGKQATISDLTTIRSGAGLGATALQESDIINNTTSTTANKPLSANMGKSLQDQINNLNTRGKYLSLWNCVTGLAMDDPPVTPYTVETGSFLIVGQVASAGGTNYRPSGSTYDKDTPSTTVETADVKVNDTYYYDGTVWRLLHTDTPSVSFSSLAGNPSDNTALANALSSKVEYAMAIVDLGG